MNIDRKLIDQPKVLLRPVKTWSIDFLALRDSIKDSGILQDLIVRKKGARFELVDGMHRLECAVQLNLKEVPCKVLDLTDSDCLIMQIKMNSSFIPTSKYEFAKHLKLLLLKDPSLDLYRLASAISKPVDWVRKILSLNRLDEEVAERISKTSLKSQLAMAKLPVEVQKECVDFCLEYSTQEFQSYVDRKLKLISEALLFETNEKIQTEFKLKPSLRSLRQILRERETGVAGRLLILDEDTPEDIWNKALDWVTHQDSVSQKEYVEKVKKSLARKKENLNKGKLRKRKTYE